MKRLFAGMPSGAYIVLGVVLGMEEVRPTLLSGLLSRVLGKEISPPGQQQGVMQRLGMLSLKRLRETPRRPLPDKVVRPLRCSSQKCCTCMSGSTSHSLTVRVQSHPSFKKHYVSRLLMEKAPWCS
jgi:hypothetical protein